MIWKRQEPDPLEERRRQLAVQQRLLLEQQRRLREELQSGGSSKPVEPPVWRMEEDARPARAAEPTPARKRNLARQRQRDMVLFFACFALLLLVLAVVLWVAYVHNTASVNGA
jgi:hypothetical protein